MKFILAILIVVGSSASAQRTPTLPVKSVLDCTLNYGSKSLPLDMKWNGNEAGIMSAKGSIDGVEVELLEETQFNPKLTGFLRLPGVAPGRQYMISFDKDIAAINPAEYTSRIIYHLTDTDRSREIYVICERKPGTYK